MLRQETVPGAIKPASAPRTHSVVPWLLGLIAILVIALVGAGAWYAAPMLTTTRGEGLADGMIAAWNAHDAAATSGYYTDDAILMSSSDQAPIARGATAIGSNAQYGGLTIERTGPVSESGDLVWWPIHVSSQYDVAGDNAVAVMVLRDGKIAQHWVIWG